MKKIIAVLNTIVILIAFCGCNDAYSELGDIISNDEIITDSVTEKTESSFAEDGVLSGSSEISNTKAASSSSTVSRKSSVSEKTENTENTENTERGTNSSVSLFPLLKYSANDSNTVFRDIAELENGNFAVAGRIDNEEGMKSFIRIYNDKIQVINERSFEDGNGFEKIGVCKDGGYIAVSYCPPTLTKLNKSLELEWVKPYEDVTLEGQVQDIEEINPDCYAVLFSPSPYKTLKIAFLNQKGDITEAVDLMKNTDISDGDIIPDGKDGFYLVSTCNESLADKYDLVKAEYNQFKSTEVIVMHFDNNNKLAWTKTIGGGGNDWVEESIIDNDGNFYIAVSTDWYGADDFWDMSVDRASPFRRMLVKLDKDGNILFKTPLSDKGMAVDQVFGIMTDSNNVYVVGMADYFDGYQVKYPCEQISKEEKGERVFSVYTARFTADGKELGRNIFRCDINDTPTDSVLLKNGTIVIAGSLSEAENPFKISFPNGVQSLPALFCYTAQ